LTKIAILVRRRMTATAHAIVGAAIISKITNPVAGFSVAFISHFFLDKFPHWDPMTNRKTKTQKRILVETIVDVFLGFGLIYLIFVLGLKKDPGMIFLAAFVSQLPDWAEIPYTFFKLKLAGVYQIYRLQKWFHDVGFNSRAQAPWGIITQILTCVIFLLWSLL